MLFNTLAKLFGWNSVAGFPLPAILGYRFSPGCIGPVRMPGAVIGASSGWWDEGEQECILCVDEGVCSETYVVPCMVKLTFGQTGGSAPDCIRGSHFLFFNSEGYWYPRHICNLVPMIFSWTGTNPCAGGWPPGAKPYAIVLGFTSVINAYVTDPSLSWDTLEELLAFLASETPFYLYNRGNFPGAGCNEGDIEPFQCLNYDHWVYVEPQAGYPYEVCCERHYCPSGLISSTGSPPENPDYLTEQGPCCFSVSFSGISKNGPECYYGYPADLSNELLSPQDVLYRQSDNVYPCDKWVSSPYGCISPFPNELSLSFASPFDYFVGDPVDDCGWGEEFSGPTCGNFRMTLSGSESIVIEGESEPVIQTVVFQADLPGNPYCCCCSEFYDCGEPPIDFIFHWINVFQHPLLHREDLQNIPLAFSPGGSNIIRGPDYSNAIAYVSLVDTEHGDCHNLLESCTLDSVFGWQLTTTDLRGNENVLVLTKTDNFVFRWSNGLSSWEIYIEPSLRSGACQLQLFFSCAKRNFNYGFCIPKEADPCTIGDMLCTLTDDIPLEPSNRYAYLECGFMPGSIIKVEPLDGPEGSGECIAMPDPLPGSECAADSWSLTWTPPGEEETTVSIEASGEIWYLLDGESGLEYTIDRLDDGFYGEGNYQLTVELHDEARTVYIVNFNTAGVIDCCYSGEIEIRLGSGQGSSATIEAVCPSACDATHWDVEINGVPYQLDYYRGYWHYTSGEEVPELLLDLVRLTNDGGNTRYVFVKSELNVGVYINSYCDVPDGSDCCLAGELGPFNLLDTGESVTLEAICLE